MHFDAIPCIIANVMKEHVSEGDIMFTKVLAQGLNFTCISLSKFSLTTTAIAFLKK